MSSTEVTSDGRDEPSQALVDEGVTPCADLSFACVWGTTDRFAKRSVRSTATNVSPSRYNWHSDGLLGTDMDHGSAMRRLYLILALALFAGKAEAQPAPGPPAVGVVRAERQQITQTDEFIGRIQSIGRVALVARVTAYLEKRLFVEGSEVKQGDLLYQLEQPPFQAQVDADQGECRAARSAAHLCRAAARAVAVPDKNACRPAADGRPRRLQ